MNRFKFFGSRPVFCLDAPAGGGGGDGGAAAGGGTGGGGSTSTPTGGMSAADIAADGGDIAFLEQDAPAAEPEARPAEGGKEKQGSEPEEINLSLLEEGQPEWLAKVTDKTAKSEITKLLEANKKFSEKFKDAADLDAFFKDLPGGREQVAALQTLSREVAEIDANIEANTPEGNASVVERYLGEAPDGGLGLFRAGAAHLAKTNPEAWAKVGGELINESLKASGIGADLQTVVGAIQEMRQAVAKDDGEAFGKAAAKLLGEPQKEAKPDANASKAAEATKTADAERVKAQTESWEFRNEKSTTKIENHVATETGKLLAKVLPASISEKDRASLRSEIGQEILSQLTADAWLTSKVTDLIGYKSGKEGNWNYGKTNLRASQQDWDKATELIVNAATPKLIAKAVSKIVSQWSRDRAASNKDSRDKARGAAAQGKEVGAGKTAGNGKARQPLTPEQIRAMSDEEWLNY